ncbi:hypothetical protein [Spiroplasma endosymbiont of 'Nebria riversi']|uniref:hypothetical protein n=1 Tax=Spiroplasma endosymbiont of 'Nebria riversi' TaxID=2792084 RepID=UPI001C03EDB9|nr:hypothetical protein [Spiroplasma endosymbiont of 'Nebria riversi']
MLNYNLLNKINVHDKRYTQKYVIKSILEFLKPNSTILCPFDKIDSEFVCVLEKNGHKVWNSHIEDGIDFFNYIKSDVDRYDYIISNPPFSKRKQVIEHLFNLGKPFAMLIPLVSIALKPIREKIDQCELLVFNKRIKFIAYNGIVCKNPPSETAYICHNVLPKQIVYRKLKELKNENMI